MRDLLNERIDSIAAAAARSQQDRARIEMELRLLIVDCCAAQQCSGCGNPEEHERCMRQRFAPEPRMTWFAHGKRGQATMSEAPAAVAPDRRRGADVNRATDEERHARAIQRAEKAVVRAAIKHYRIEDCRGWIRCPICDVTAELLAARAAAKKGT